MPSAVPVLSDYMSQVHAGMPFSGFLGVEQVEGLAGSFRGTSSHRRAEAEAAIAVLDGLLLLRQLSGPAAANRAASRLGVR